MEPPADTLRLVDEAIRTDLQGLHDSFFAWLIIFTVIVAAGVVLEEVFEWIPLQKNRLDLSTGLMAPRVRLSAWIHRLTRIGWILVVVGVIGEGVFEGLVSKADRLLQDFSDVLLNDANNRALANEKESQALRIRTQREIEARIELEKELLWDGPRDRLLYSERTVLDRRLKRFSGQRFRMSLCIPDLGLSFGESRVTEVALAEQAVRILLSEAGWTPTAWPGLPPSPPIPLMLQGCTGPPGIAVCIAPGAPESTRAAARELRSVIETVLKQKPYFADDRIVPGWGIASSNGAFPSGEIEIHVGVHPIVRGDPSKTVEHP